MSNTPGDVTVRITLGVMVLYFGSSFSLYALADDAFGVSTVNAIRFAVAAGVLMIVAARRLGETRPVLRPLLLAGAGGVGLMAVLMTYGIDRSSATLAALVMGTESIGIALAAAVIARDRPSRNALAGLAIGFTGAAVASGIVTEPPSAVPLLAVASLIGAVVAFSIYAAIARKISPGVDSLAVTAVTQVGAAMFAIPAMTLDLADRGIVRADITPKAGIAVIVLGLGSAGGYLLLTSVLSHQPAGRVAVAMYMLPVVGVLVAWALTGRQPYGRDAIGGSLIILAVWLSERRTAEATTSAP